MKTSARLTCIALWFTAAVFSPSPVSAAESASITGILILATNGPGETDARLRSYEPTLRRLFNFQSYRQIGRDAVSIDLPGTGVLSYGDGQNLVIKTTRGGGGSIRATVHWNRGSRTLIKTTVVMKPGIPTLLGGPRKDGGGNLIVILVAK